MCLGPSETAVCQFVTRAVDVLSQYIVSVSFWITSGKGVDTGLDIRLDPHSVTNLRVEESELTVTLSWKLLLLKHG